MTFFKSSLNLALLSLLTCTGLAAPALATADSDNSIRNAQFEGNVDRFGQSRQINGDVTATNDLEDFRKFLLTGKATLHISGKSNIAPNGGRTDLLLVRDFNNNGVLDSGELIAKSSGSFQHSFTRKDLLAGNYIVILRNRELNSNKVQYQVTVDPQ